jgi:hypothetical protein
LLDSAGFVNVDLELATLERLDSELHVCVGDKKLSILLYLPLALSLTLSLSCSSLALSGSRSIKRMTFSFDGDRPRLAVQLGSCRSSPVTIVSVRPTSESVGFSSATRRDKSGPCSFCPPATSGPGLLVPRLVSIRSGPSSLPYN